MKKIELLAPAGSKEAFIAAVQNGADAIYVGGQQFGARAYASNFDRETMVSMFQYAHIHGVNVYVTVNTVVFEDEFEEVKDYLTFLYTNQCDGVIVQDLGVISYLRNTYPDFKIIGSTQMNIHNVQGAKLLKELGINRVVVARETSLQELIAINKEVPDIELEVFGHGALCIAYSGQCLMSSYIGKRSGNRGRCAQSCRLNYRLMKDGNYLNEEAPLLSTKDLLTLENLDKIIEANASSLKIEGRMKSSEYVALVIRTYRKAIDAYYERKRNLNYKKEIYDLKRVFNREFTKGYLLNENFSDVVNIYRNNHQGVEIGRVIDVKNNVLKIRLSEDLNQFDGIRIISKEDVGFTVNKMMIKGLLVNKAKKGEVVFIESKAKVRANDIVMKTLDIKQMEELQKTYDKDYRKVKINAKLIALEGKPLELYYNDFDGHMVYEKSTYIVESAINAPLNKLRAEEQVGKLGNTSYVLNKFSFISSDNPMVPMKFINELRVKCIEKIDTLRINRYKDRIAKEEVLLKLPKQKKTNDSLSVLINNEEQIIPLLNKNISTIYVKNRAVFNKLKNEYKDENIVFAQNRIEKNLLKENEQNVLVCENGGLSFAKNNSVVSDVYLNITNSRAVALLLSLGIKKVGISLECDYERLELLINNFASNYYCLPPLEMLIYGYNDLMITKYCPISKMNGSKNKFCNECHNHNYYLEDRIKVLFPLLGDSYCTMHILNSRRLNLIEHVSKLKTLVHHLRLDFTIETNYEIEQIIDSFLAAFQGLDTDLKLDNVTYGHFKTKVL